VKIEEGSEAVDISNDQADDSSTAEESEKISEEARTATRQPFAASTASVGGAASPSTSPEAVLLAPDVSSSSSDGDSEKCPICLTTLAAQGVGTPNTCDHLFCMGCLEEWSANANTCPVDRQEFNAILVRNYPKGEVIRRIPVSPRLRELGYEVTTLEDIGFCEMCGEIDHRDRMWYCQRCTLLYHPQCVRPLQETVSSEETFCPICLVFDVFVDAILNAL
jgi:PHD and RING finger domain-containing protein 1